jgi:histidinol-phosphatase (PHP family)
MAHPDLVAKWGEGRPRPSRDPRFYYEPAVEAMAEAGVVVEVSTAGLRKPVGSLYPAADLALMLVDAGVPFSLSSDAHDPGEIGYAYDRAIDQLGEWGVREIAVFERRERRMEPLG